MMAGFALRAFLWVHTDTNEAGSSYLIVSTTRRCTRITGAKMKRMTTLAGTIGFVLTGTTLLEVVQPRGLPNTTTS
jgi:hypothetical protein